MAKKSLKTLCKNYEVENYFDVIIDSYINGYPKQCKDQFSVMGTKDKKEFILYCLQFNYASDILRIIL